MLRSGPLPEDWYQLPLEVVRLDQNLIEGELPPAWFGEGPLSSSLTVLTLWDNKLTGGLPDTQGSMQVSLGWVQGATLAPVVYACALPLICKAHAVLLVVSFCVQSCV
jgi:hypothetical protein